MSVKANTDLNESVQQTFPAKKFYFLEYFYVLLKSVQRYKTPDQIFDLFKILKQEYQLGESRYKKLTTDGDDLSQTQLNRYRYTFTQVISESKEYGLLTELADGSLILTRSGVDLLQIYESQGAIPFYHAVCQRMEQEFAALRYFIEFLYKVNQYRPGLLVLPNYSPSILNFRRNEITTAGHIVRYCETLVSRLKQDIHEYLGLTLNILYTENEVILNRLRESGLLPKNNNEQFNPNLYSAIIKRIRDFWRNFFLREIYAFEHSLSSFDIWAYRGKQIGVVQTTEFYPGFNGRIVYPTSVVKKNITSGDFMQIFGYPDGKQLYLHFPKWEKTQNEFVDYLVKAYFDLRRSNRSYFINLPALRELVCYSMKIPDYVFGNFLENVYKLNLQGNLQVKISLEVDKLPEETNAMYLKREPVMVDGKYRNIIAIDVAKGN